MAEWQGKSKGTPLGYKIFIFVIKNLGIKAAYLLLYPVVAYYYFFSRASNKALNEYFSKLLAINPNLKTSRYKSYYNLGQVIVDKTAVISGVHGEFNITHDGGQYLEAMSNDNSGGFLISAHVGNWEAAGHLMKRFNRPINIVLLDAEHEQIKKVIDNAVGERNFKMIPMKADMSHIFKIKEAAEKKELICIHGDRFLPGSKTLRAKFLGHDALFPMGPFAMAAKLGLPVAFVYGMKDSPTHYHFYCSKPQFEVKDKNSIFKDYLDLLETMVQRYPNQWFNYFPFWANSSNTN